MTRARKPSEVKSCNVPDCPEDGSHGRGLCGRHYFWKNSPDPEKVAIFEKYASPAKRGPNAKKTAAAPSAPSADEVAERPVSGLAPKGDDDDPVVDETKRTERADGRISAACEVLQFFGMKPQRVAGGLRFELPDEVATCVGATHLMIDDGGALRSVKMSVVEIQRLGS